MLPKLRYRLKLGLANAWYLWLEFLIYVKVLKRGQSPSKHLLIIRCDAIGDYILFRNALRTIRQSPKYKDAKITLLGNPAWKTIWEALDQKEMDQVLWIERKKLLFQPRYALNLVKKIGGLGITDVFNATYGRDYYIDVVVKAAQAPTTWGTNQTGVYYTKFQQWSMRDLYTHRLEVEHIRFELDKTRHAVGQLLGEEIPLLRPSMGEIPWKPIPLPPTFVVVALGAQAAFRRWSPQAFANLAIQILNFKPQVHIVLVGAETDKSLEKAFGNAIGNRFSERIHTLVGKLSLVELAEVIEKATLVCCNDTGVYHMAVACGTKVCVISNGNHFGRFIPYPDAYGVEAFYFYPPSFEATFPDDESKIKATENQSPFDIQEITPEKVWENLQNFF